MMKRIRRWLFRLKWERAPNGIYVSYNAYARIAVAPVDGGYTWIVFDPRLFGQVLVQANDAWPRRRKAMRLAERWAFILLEVMREDEVHRISTWASWRR